MNWKWLETERVVQWIKQSCYAQFSLALCNKASVQITLCDVHTYNPLYTQSIRVQLCLFKPVQFVKIIQNAEKIKRVP